MKKREIIIIAVAVVFVVYALLDFFVLSGKPKNGEDQKITDQVGKIAAFAETAGSELTAVAKQKESPDMEYLVSKIESDWPHDPFVAQESVGVQDAPASDAPKLSYTGFIKAGKKILAVINGMEYEIGELLKDVGYKVSAVTPSQVVLLTEFNKEIILQLEEN